MIFNNIFPNNLNKYIDGTIKTFTGSLSEVYNMQFYNKRWLTGINLPNCISIGESAFSGCSSLTTVNFPNCTSIGTYAFYGCYSLTTISFPNCTFIGSDAFYRCSSLTTISFPNCISVGAYAFYSCVSLTTVNFPNCTFVGSYAFCNCSNLISVNLTSVFSITEIFSDVFASTPIGGYSDVAGQYGSVYVPASLYNGFITASYWSDISARIVSV